MGHDTHDLSADILPNVARSFIQALLNSSTTTLLCLNVHEKAIKTSAELVLLSNDDDDKTTTEHMNIFSIEWTPRVSSSE